MSHHPEKAAAALTQFNKCLAPRLTYQAQLIYERTKGEDSYTGQDNQVLKITTANANREYALKIVPLISETIFSPGQEALYKHFGRRGLNYHLLTPIIYWLTTNDTLLYLVMPYLKGKSLSDLLLNQMKNAEDQTPLGCSFALNFASHISRAFTGMRKLNLIHGDLKKNEHYWITDRGHFLHDFEFTHFIENDYDQRRARFEVTEFFETCGQLLIDMDTYLIVRTLTNYASTLLDPDQKGLHPNVRLRIEQRLGQTTSQLESHHQERIDRYHLNFFDQHEQKLKYVFHFALLMEKIEDNYGLPTTQIFSSHLQQCIEDSQYPVQKFADDLTTALA